MLKIPSKVKIGSTTYNVEERTMENLHVDNVGKLFTSSENFHMGLTNNASGEILVLKELKHDIKLHTVFHEICHGYARVYGFENPNEENQCNLFATIILQFINDNIEEIKWKEGNRE